MIRKSDALAQVDYTSNSDDMCYAPFLRDRIRELPAVTMGVKPIGADGVKIHPQDILNAAWRDDLGEEGLAMYDRILAALTPIPVDDSQPADPAAIREAALLEAAAIAHAYHQKALEWAKKVRGLEQHVVETDSLRIANAILDLAKGTAE